MEQLSATTDDGVVLALRRFPALGSARAVCLCTHAMMANSSYLSSGDGGGFAGFLASAGIDTYVLDWRGHGGSVPPSPRTGGWTFDDYVQRDLPAAIAAVGASAQIEASELCYLGHSLGGLVGLAAFGTGVVPCPRRLALCATSLWLPGPRGPWQRRALMQVYALSARAFGYAPIRRLRMGSSDEPRSYVRQLVGWAESGRWTSCDGVDYLATLRNIDSRTWAICGDGDPMCSRWDAAVMARRIRGALPQRQVGVRHGDAVDADHFTLFTRRELAPLWVELVDFIVT